MLRLWCLSFGWSPAHDKCFIGVFLSTGVQVAQFEDVKFEAASLLSELYCQQVRLSSQTSIFCKAMYCEKLYSDRSMLIHGVLYVNPLQIIHQEWFNTWTLTCNALTCQKWLFALLFSRTWLILRSRCYGRPSRSRSRRRTGTADCCFSWRYVKPFITAHLKHLWWWDLMKVTGFMIQFYSTMHSSSVFSITAHGYIFFSECQIYELPFILSAPRKNTSWINQTSRRADDRSIQS